MLSYEACASGGRTKVANIASCWSKVNRICSSGSEHDCDPRKDQDAQKSRLPIAAESLGTAAFGTSLPAECECEGARGGVSVASSLPCLPRAESPRSPGAVLLRARRSKRTPRPRLIHARALLQQGTLPPLLLTFSTVSSSGPGDACILQRKVSLTIKAHGSTMSTGGRR